MKKPMTGPYKLFDKGYIELAADVAAEDVKIEFERAATEERREWQTTIHHKTYTPRQIALRMYEALENEQDQDDPDPKMRTYYTDNFPVERLEKIVKDSLARRGMKEATDNIKQKFLQALGTLRRKTSENVRYTLNPDCFKMISTRQRQADSVSAAELKRDKIFYFTDQTRGNLREEQLEFFDEVTEAGSVFRSVPIINHHDFKTPLNAVIADSEPEKKFIKAMLENRPHYDAWIKSTSMRFYEIEYAWKKGEHAKRGKFNPDFFIKAGNWILVVEIKEDGELQDPSEENRKKNEYAIAHFKRVDQHLEQEGSALRYKFNFLTPSNFNKYFHYLREGRMEMYTSDLDVELGAEI